jgi:DNA-binding NarL/FixJ family response regulator
MTEQLNEREIEVLQMLADGKTQREAARSLRLAHRTIKDYSTRLREKLDAKTTYNALATALRRGLID